MHCSIVLGNVRCARHNFRTQRAGSSKSLVCFCVSSDLIDHVTFELHLRQDSMAMSQYSADIAERIMNAPTPPRDAGDHYMHDEDTHDEDPSNDGRGCEATQAPDTGAMVAFLGRCKAAGDQFRDGLHVSIVEDIRSIKAVAISTMEMCRHKFPNRGRELLRVLAAAVHIYRARISDLGLREHCFYLHLIAGGHLVRAHDGQFFTYRDGAFHAYNGLIDETLLDVFRSFFWQLEGLVVLLNTRVNDLSQDAFLGAISRLLEERVSQETPQGSEAADLTFLKNCEAVALAAPHRQDENREGDSDTVKNNYVRNVVTKLSAALQRELLDKRVISYYTEWCSTPKTYEGWRRLQGFVCFFHRSRGHDVS